MRYLARKLSAVVVISAMLTQACYAQAPPPSDSQKAEASKRKLDEKATDEAYRATLKRFPAVDRKVDPWGGLRTPSDSGNK
jgi:hypothetical protein